MSQHHFVICHNVEVNCPSQVPSPYPGLLQSSREQVLCQNRCNILSQAFVLLSLPLFSLLYFLPPGFTFLLFSLILSSFFLFFLPPFFPLFLLSLPSFPSPSLPPNLPPTCLLRTVYGQTLFYWQPHRARQHCILHFADDKLKPQRAKIWTEANLLTDCNV